MWSCVPPREDDDINDVASMAGVNLTEENAQILTTVVGSVVQSCQDQLFLSPNLLLSRILHAGTSSWRPSPTDVNAAWLGQRRVQEGVGGQEGAGGFRQTSVSVLK